MSKSIRVLGIETSCDETAAAVVEDGRHIYTNAIASQIAIHQPYSGIVPELASRAHVENVQLVVESAVKGMNGRDTAPFPKTLPVDVIAVTVGPGLMGSLLVGKTVAEMLAWVYQKPLVGVNHLEGHLFSVLPASHDLNPPFLALIVSGGHTELVHVKNFGDYDVLGRTRDDAAGEAFDKVAKMLGLGYPGGPVIDQLAAKGNPAAIQFPRPFLSDGWDFSFSGLKTSVLYYLRDNPNATSSKKKVADVCASFQAAVVEVLVNKTLAAAAKLDLKHIVLGGGVAANSALRSAFAHHGKKYKIHTSSLLLCTDNAVMIAVAGYYKFLKGGRKKFSPESLEVDSTLSFQSWK
ncbi:MAG: tRNA (adenosine(37)-N6)-threonylcarbamoyltransferase complex transferase subunit TsaD [Elusimicrobia bacterium]|nr:tRNA (adenosine(37)-N6)-threonylcarbamoyltransferase complex transferase subunit TsaD [Elusimicrobiota bacterium]